MPRTPEDDLRLIAFLRSIGATDEEIEEATTVENLGPLGLELALRPPGPLTTLDDLAALAEVEPEVVHRLWRALGLPADAARRVPPDAAEAMHVLLFLVVYLSEEEALALARVIGAATASIAGALSNATRVRVEVPTLESGTPYSEVVRQQVHTVRELLPTLWDAVGAVFRRHLALVSAQPWRIDDDHTAVTITCTVGFIDVVASTELLVGASPSALARLVNRFESVVWDAVGRHGGRVVKLIGDEAMFTVPSPADAVAFAEDVLERAEDRVRIGLAHGPAVAYHGDHYGETVNLAARLVGAAEAGTALVSSSIAAAVDGSRFERAEIGPLRGFPADTAAFVLRPTS